MPVRRSLRLGRRRKRKRNRVVKGQRGGERKKKSVAHPAASLFYLAPCYTRRYVFYCALSRGVYTLSLMKLTFPRRCF